MVLTPAAVQRCFMRAPGSDYSDIFPGPLAAEVMRNEKESEIKDGGRERAIFAG